MALSSGLEPEFQPSQGCELSLTPREQIVVGPGGFEPPTLGSKPSMISVSPRTVGWKEGNDPSFLGSQPRALPLCYIHHMEPDLGLEPSRSPLRGATVPCTSGRSLEPDKGIKPFPQSLQGTVDLRSSGMESQVGIEPTYPKVKSPGAIPSRHWPKIDGAGRGTRTLTLSRVLAPRASASTKFHHSSMVTD